MREAEHLGISATEADSLAQTFIPSQTILLFFHWPYTGHCKDFTRLVRDMREGWVELVCISGSYSKLCAVQNQDTE